TASGKSAARGSLTAFPLSHVSATASISILSSIQSAILLKIFALSATDILPHTLKATCAASIAAFTYSLVDLANSQKTSPVTGLTFSKYFPFAGGLYSPPIKLSYLSLKFTRAPSVFGLAYLTLTFLLKL